MVKFFTVVATSMVLVLSAISTTQAAYVLSSGQFTGKRFSTKNELCTSKTYELATKPLKAGGVFCSYFADLGISICQCHEKELHADGQNGFTNDVFYHSRITGFCMGPTANKQYTEGWVNGFYPQSNMMSAAVVRRGRVTTTSCRAVGCSRASEGLSWRHLSTVGTSC
ncbi:hypothetical protein BG004_003082 [Podila humilis]|nr:hypothetical protein BG004_003082 [Podila humilis]